MIQNNFKSIHKMVQVNNSYQDTDDESIRETCTSEWLLFCFVYLNCKAANYACFIFNLCSQLVNTVKSYLFVTLQILIKRLPIHFFSLLYSFPKTITDYFPSQRKYLHGPQIRFCVSRGLHSTVLKEAMIRFESCKSLSVFVR